MLGVEDSLYFGDGIGSRGEINGDDSTQQQQSNLFPQNGEFQKLHSVFVDGGDRFGVSSVAFDLHEELIWMGNQGGHVTSYYGSGMEKYTSFQVHATQEIRQILPCDELILILSASQLRGQVRRGLPVFSHTSENMQEMQCMLQTTQSNVIIGGHQSELIEFDLASLTQTNTVELGFGGCAILRSQGRLICVGDPSGQINLLDSRTFRREQTLDGHSGSLSDFDVHGNLLVTCGFSSRHGNLSVDRFLKVYDVRVLRALPPVPISIDPFLLRFLPSFSSRVATVSPSGQMEILEVQAISQSNICLYQVTTNSSMCLSFDVSSSCHQMAFGDTNGSLHLFSTSPSVMFNSFSRDTEFPDPVETFPPMNVNDEFASFANIPLHLSSSPLLSDWPVEYCIPSYRPIIPIDPNILQSMKMVGTIGYAPNPGTFRRNQMQYKIGTEASPSPTPMSHPLNGSSPTQDIINSNQNGSPHNDHHHSPGQQSHVTTLNNHKNSSHQGFQGPQGLSPQQQQLHLHHPVHGGNLNSSKHHPPHPSLQQQHHFHGPQPPPQQQHLHHHQPPLPNMMPGMGPPPPHPQGPLGPQHHPHGGPHHPPVPPHQFYYPPHHQPPMGGPPGPHGHLQPGGPPPPGLGGPHQSSPRAFYHNTKHSPTFMKNLFHPGKRTFHYSRFQPPKRYTRYEWKKNFFEDSDMDNFNRTKFPGLEATQGNSYCNSILQILYHIDYLRGSLVSHLCEKEACVSCELGFLFHMLDNSRVVPCLASNFLRAFRLVPEASAVGILVQEGQSKQRAQFLRHVQGFNRFILHQIGTETSKKAQEQKEPEDINFVQLFEMKQENVNRCTRCGREERKETVVLLSNLLYSPDATSGGKRCRFVDLLARSLYPEHTCPAWCEKCEKYQSTFQSRFPKAFPPIISLNTCLDNSHDFQTWRNYMESLLPEKVSKPEGEGQIPGGPAGPSSIRSGHPLSPGAPPSHVKSCRYGRNCMRPDCKFWHEGRVPKIDHSKMTEFEVNPEVQVKWLPKEIRIWIEENRKVHCMDLETQESSSLLPPPEDSEVKTSESDDFTSGDYELFAVACFVRDSDVEDRSNLVALIHVDKPYFQRTDQPELKSDWFLFNDFCIREVPISEAYSFNPKWKIPCVVYYRRKEIPEALLNPPVPRSIATIEMFKKVYGSKVNLHPDRVVTFKPLTEDEIPQKDALVAMDAEFVTLGQEETELRIDGKLSTVKPQQLTVARVTCIRGQGPLEGTPFLDDYISTQEVVVDYLTKFSGIQPGDLDANFSSKNLTVLKTLYLKLRYLIDSGVKFVGHGLNNDFRVINLVVPPDQVIDTVSLFYLPNQRMVSLRFLAWHFLGIVIQSEVHDSVEDARTALLLYRKYEELQNSGKIEKALEDLYETGKKMQWKIPNESLDK